MRALSRDVQRAEVERLLRGGVGDALVAQCYYTENNQDDGCDEEGFHKLSAECQLLNLVAAIVTRAEIRTIRSSTFSAPTAAQHEEADNAAKKGSRSEKFVGVVVHYPICRPGALPDALQSAVAQWPCLRPVLASLLVGICFFHAFGFTGQDYIARGCATIRSLPHESQQGGVANE